MNMFKRLVISMNLTPNFLKTPVIQLHLKICATYIKIHFIWTRITIKAPILYKCAIGINREEADRRPIDTVLFLRSHIYI